MTTQETQARQASFSAFRSRRRLDRGARLSSRRFGRKSALVAGTALAIVLVVSSLAFACLPGVAPNLTKFKIKDNNGNVVSMAGVGTQLRAVGTNIDKPAWPYQIKLLVAPYDPNNTRACGDSGIPQAVGQTTPTVATWNVPPQSFTGNLDVPFVLTAASQGPAHFCAIPNGRAEGSTLPVITALEYYVFEPFTVL